MLLCRFLKNKVGSIFVLAGFSLSTLVAASGISIDVGMAALTQNKAQQAADAAALAGGLSADSLTLEETNKMINRYFSLNFPDGYMGSTVSTSDLNRTIDTTTNTVTVSLNDSGAQSFFSSFLSNQEDSVMSFDVAAAVQAGTPVSQETSFMILLDLHSSISLVPCSTLTAACTGDAALDSMPAYEHLYRSIINSLVPALSDAANQNTLYLASYRAGGVTGDGMYGVLGGHQTDTITASSNYEIDLEIIQEYYEDFEPLANMNHPSWVMPSVDSASKEVLMVPFWLGDHEAASANQKKTIIYITTGWEFWYRGQYNLLADDCDYVKNEGNIELHTIYFNYTENLNGAEHQNLIDGLRGCASSPSTYHEALNQHDLQNVFSSIIQFDAPIPELRIAQ